MRAVPLPPALMRSVADRSGSAAIEFAVVAPLLALMVVGVVEIGLAARQALQIQGAAEAGALYAANNGWDAAAIGAAVSAATGSAGITASPAPRSFCACPGAAGLAEVACTATCTDGRTAATYVEVSASVPRQSLLTSDLPLATTIIGRSTVRLP